MANAVKKQANGVLTLRAQTAADLMSPRPVSIGEGVTFEEAVSLLTDKGFSAAPVIDAAGRPVGVLSRTDVLTHERERSRAESATPMSPTLVRDLMTPALFSVGPETPARQVVEQLLELNVHQLFVVDEDGVLVGVVSAMDVLRNLKPGT